MGRPDLARQLDQRHPGERGVEGPGIIDHNVNFQDGKLSAQFEQTMVVTDTGVEVLSARPGKLHTPHFMESS